MLNKLFLVLNLPGHSPVGKLTPASLKLHPAACFGLFLWLLALALIMAKVLLEPAGQHTVVDSYLLGAERWINREKLYSGPGGFIYTPTFAVLFVPLTKVPLFWADLLWRLLIIGLYFWGSVRLLKHFQGYSHQSVASWVGFYSLIAVPIAFSGFRNGQMNVVLIAVMLLVTCMLIEKRWNWAALLLALVMSLKPTFIVFFLLTTSLFKPLWYRVPPTLLAFLLLPVAFGGADYALAQYHYFIEMADSAMDYGMETPTWATFFNIPMQVSGFEISKEIQNIIKVLLAGLTWVGCFYAIVRHGTKNGLVYLLSFVACYHLLFNPRSVNTDYIILGTVIGFWFTASINLWSEKQLGWITGLIALGVLFAFDLSRTIIPDTTSWVNPIMAVIFTGVLIWQLKGKKVFAP